MLTNFLSFSMLDPGFLTGMGFMYILAGEYMMKPFLEISNPFEVAPAFLCSTVPVKNLACHKAMQVAFCCCPILISKKSKKNNVISLGYYW